MKKRIAVFILALITVLSAGCSNADHEENNAPTPEQTAEQTPAPTSAPTATPEPTAEPTPEAEPEEPAEEPEEISVICNPLTGLPCEVDVSQVRPYAIMLNNLREAMPQQGNSCADIIYEAIAEGGITRMLGVYQSVDGIEAIGSVRSSRPYYIELAMGHDAVYVHAGGSEEAYADLSSWGTIHMDGVNGTFSSAAAGVFWRDQDRWGGKHYAYEHSLLTSGARLQSAAERFGISLKHTEGYDCGLRFSDDGTPIDGENASYIKVPFSSYKTGVFRYDEENGVYKVEEYAAAYIDGNTNEQVCVTNVITLRVSCYNTGDSYGHMRVTFGSGEGWYACGGKIIPIKWSKADRNSPIIYYNTDGTELLLGRGKTYVNLIPLENSVSYE